MKVAAKITWRLQKSAAVKTSLEETIEEFTGTAEYFSKMSFNDYEYGHVTRITDTTYVAYVTQRNMSAPFDTKAISTALDDAVQVLCEHLICCGCTIENMIITSATIEQEEDEE